MAWTDPTTRSSGTLITDTIWNTDLVDNLNYLSGAIEPDLTNNSGGSVAAGDVVVLDSANNSSFTTTTTQGDQGVIGVAMEAINNTASGRVAIIGVVTVNVTGTVTRGNYLETSTTAKLAIDAGSSEQAGTFARALTGGTGSVTAVILPAFKGANVIIGEEYWGGNLIHNYPSMEGADGAEPVWWDTQDATLTLTEEDGTGEALPDLRNERVLKIVNSASGGDKYIFDRLTYANEKALDNSYTVVSAGCWVYTASAGTITLNLQDSVSGSLGTATTTTTSAWVWLEVKNKTLGSGANLEFRVKHSANSATYYVANPTLNVGSLVRAFEPRRLRYVSTYFSDKVNVNPSDSNWQTVDITTETSDIAALAHFAIRATRTASSATVHLRRTGSGLGQVSATRVGEIGASSNLTTNNAICELNNVQQFDWSVVDDTGVDDLEISIVGFWEWA